MQINHHSRLQCSQNFNSPSCLFDIDTHLCACGHAPQDDTHTRYIIMQSCLLQTTSTRLRASCGPSEVHITHRRALCCKSTSLKPIPSFQAVSVQARPSDKTRRTSPHEFRSCMMSVAPHQTAHTHEEPDHRLVGKHVDVENPANNSTSIPSRSAVQREDTITAIVTGEDP